MRIYAAILMAVWILVLFGCVKQDPCQQITNADLQPAVCLISPETATVIAKGYLFLDYELDQFQPEVIADEDTYEVHFKRIRGPNIGTGPVVFIRKSNGERTYTIHSK